MSAPPPLDDVDRQILELLREDARRTVRDIAARVQLSPTPVKRRIDRLEQTGVIAGYTVQLDHSKIGSTIEAFVELRFAGDADADAAVARIVKLPGVREAFVTAGDPDALVRLRLDDVADLQRVVNGLRRSGAVIGTKTLMVLGRSHRPD